MKPQNILISAMNVELLTTVYPKQDAETIILLHGGPGVPMTFSTIAEYLSRRYQIIIFDQRGTRLSPASKHSYGLEDYVEDINAIAHRLRLERFHLFGHSWGGLYAQIYAEKHRDRISRLFLSSPSSGTGAIWKQTENEVMSFMKKHSSFQVWTRMGINSFFGALGSDGAYRALFKQVLDNYNKDFNPAFAATDAMVENVCAESVNRTRKAIVQYQQTIEPLPYSFPIMVVYGERDIYGASKQHVTARFPNAEFREIQKAGHRPWLHNKGGFFSVLGGFYNV
jgi:proline iminopeptidase